MIFIKLINKVKVLKILILIIKYNVIYVIKYFKIGINVKMVILLKEMNANKNNNNLKILKNVKNVVRDIKEIFINVIMVFNIIKNLQIYLKRKVNLNNYNKYNVKFVIKNILNGINVKMVLQLKEK